ncbi:hypothetical protein QQS21_008195 [Conoideocrella luteorostrata]|uniref:AAA+ ATPase domain-containing protein n=1 Tax=Conoideocrella luteorostrata TaxID=1105319 RepID=A0AAJ0CK60_9HYPO|nr:hypothetical protein QQS21_008195 [Conoideocrella luteorostrata]
MLHTNASAGRADRLKKVFTSFLKGQRSISSEHDAQLFLEAVRIQESASTCLEKIISSACGLHGIRQSVRASTDDQFVCKHVIPFLAYISNPDVKAVCGGQFLWKAIATIVNPPTVWSALVQLYVNDGFLDKQADVETFAWLCIEVATHPDTDLAFATDDIITALEKRPLLNHASRQIREFGYRIQKILQLKSSSKVANSTDTDSPGGRHDNDFADFRQISVYPTADEFSSTERSFYRRAVEVEKADPTVKANWHLDNQFRLLREDMLEELQEDVRIATGRKKSHRRVQVLGNLLPVGIDSGDDKRGRCCALMVGVGSGLQVLSKKTSAQREKYLKENTNFLRHQSFGALYLPDNIVGFAFVIRDVVKLIQDPPILGLQFTDGNVLARALTAFQKSSWLKFVVVDTPVFAYEPVLQQIKGIVELPLDKQLLGLQEQSDMDDAKDKLVPAKNIQNFVETYRQRPSGSAKIRIGNGIYTLDEAQLDALIYAVESSLSVIQGPPGTGKSFIGALAAKMLLKYSPARLLVLSYTNHALDQFLEDLLKIGIDPEMMTRLGSKSTAATLCLSFDAQFRKSDSRLPKGTYDNVSHLKEEISDLRDSIEEGFKTIEAQPSFTDILDYLEFCGDSLSELAWRAFQIPSDKDGFTTMGGKGQKVQPDYLISQWMRGKGPGAFSKRVDADCRSLWEMPKEERAKCSGQWVEALRIEQTEALKSSIIRFDEAQRQIDVLFSQAKCSFIKRKRVIGCTTTAAAKYSSLIKAAEPDCVLVEEAGEILEAHVLAALNPTVKQLILIGDHKQLRPKCKNYSLSVERGDGYDLNRSLFERLILQQHRHVVLRKQHRMDPDISQLVREMTYPDLLDDEKTLDRPRTRGLRSKVLFVNHDHPEKEVDKMEDRLDNGQKASKENFFEADMVLKTVKYLGQQGYQTNNMVVLTPYLGQLRLLRDMLIKTNDPVLSDLDSHELIRAGLLTSAAGKVDKGQIRLSTIDNYQGEESDIVIASLTRSNSKGDIGFMKAPERLNVLLSRARNCLILYGNMETFMASTQGKSCWIPFFTLLKQKEFLQDGLAVQCEQHPDRVSMISSPPDFELKCPDGGCSEACGVALKCGLHTCQRRCHRLADHSNTPCGEVIRKTCDKQHEFNVKCSEKSARCPECCKIEEDLRRRAARDLEIEKATLSRRENYRRELQEIQDEIAHEKRLKKDDEEMNQQKQTLQQHKADLAELKETNARVKSMKKAAQDMKTPPSNNSKPENKDKDTIEPGSARHEWELMKVEELANSNVLDTLMSMIGLESVKKKFLEIKTTVDTATRQGISTEKERFGCSLLGHPGTGKTTVARLYANFLTSMGVLAGSCFKETTGSKLANLGVAGCQALLDEMLDNGGDVVFIDEAYQLSSGNSPGGRAVLDFLLAEVENLTSKVCFILAGYAKQMESFFAHNPGFPSRFPLEMRFDDYTDDELLKILELKTNSKYRGRMKIDGGSSGLYCRIVARRLGRGRGKDGFGNARAVENMLAVISRRQSQRLRRERHAKTKPKPDDLLFTKEDLIGPEPSNALVKSECWTKLQSLIGLDSVKASVKTLLDSIQANYQRELKEEPILEYTLNRVFLGSPGTGKTTVAKLYGQILVDIGLLSNGEVIVKNPSDFVGGALGQSEQQTKGILSASEGKVLVIDEAYGLYGASDPYKTAVVDTIVSTVHSLPGDDRCVLLLGYTDQMEEMFQNVNPGLSRRFPLRSAFVFEDFDQPQLASILDLKLKQQGFDITSEGKKVALDVLNRARNRPNFGNAGEVDILLNDSKSRHQLRLSTGKTQRTSTLEAVDFDEDHRRLETSKTNIAQFFKDTVGCGHVISLLEGYQETARTMTTLGLEPKENIPFTFLFRGPPGTGKSTTARKMGKVFYDAGFLSSARVLDCSASDLIGSYVGQTGPKVLQLLEKALGMVLLIDEAYRLADGQFAKEALDELVDAITKPRYNKRLVIILAGYEKDINHLLSTNSGLSSRFPEVIEFRGLQAEECFDLLATRLSQQKMALQQKGKGTMDIHCVDNPSDEFRTKICKSFDSLTRLPGWASARDVETVAKTVFKETIKSIAQGADISAITVSETIVHTTIHSMIRERMSRATQVIRPPAHDFQQRLPSPHQPPAVIKDLKQIMTPEQDQHIERVEEEATTDLHQPASDDPPESIYGQRRGAVRDAGVSDEVWDQLQRDMEAESLRDEKYKAKRKLKGETTDDALREKIIKELIEEEERRKKEAEMKKKLQMQGRCPVGYEWIRQDDGWRCAGGSHFMSNEEASR